MEQKSNLENDQSNSSESRDEDNQRFDTATGKPLDSPFKYQQLGIVSGQILIIACIISAAIGGLSVYNVLGIGIGMMIFFVSIPMGHINSLIRS